MTAPILLPTMFIGSSSEGMRVAEALSERLKDAAEVTIWNEGVFDLSRGTLEELVSAVHQFDFAVLVLTPDDMLISRGQEKSSPRDNVLFECGLFIGGLGRDRTFIVYDGSQDIKVPSDLAGVTLATYDGDRIKNNPSAAVRGCYARISQAIEKSEYRRAYQLMGEWRSRYCLTVSKDHQVIEDDILIKPSGGRIHLESVNNPAQDHYIAYGKLVRDRYLVGEWKSSRPTANAYGAFYLTLHPWGSIMYGYFAGPDMYNGVVHTTWILARKQASASAGEAESKLRALLDEGQAILNEKTFTAPSSREQAVRDSPAQISSLQVVQEVPKL